MSFNLLTFVLSMVITIAAFEYEIHKEEKRDPYDCGLTRSLCYSIGLPVMTFTAFLLSIKFT